MVHLDIKPSNILFRDTGEAVLVDYGLARHLELPDLMDEEFRLPYGTAPYMAPEQILGVRSDFRSDLFALGVLMYFFSTGRRPFGDPQRMNGLKKRLWWTRHRHASSILWSPRPARDHPALPGSGPCPPLPIRSAARTGSRRSL